MSFPHNLASPLPLSASFVMKPFPVLPSVLWPYDQCHRLSFLFGLFTLLSPIMLTFAIFSDNIFSCRLDSHGLYSQSALHLTIVRKVLFPHVLSSCDYNSQNSGHAFDVVPFSRFHVILLFSERKDVNMPVALRSALLDVFCHSPKDSRRTSDK